MTEKELTQKIERLKLNEIATRVVEDSSNIRAAGYHPETRAMIVEFKSNTKYCFEKVPEEGDLSWRAFEATFGDKDKSTGGYFAKHFRGWPTQFKIAFDDETKGDGAKGEERGAKKEDKANGL